MATFTTIKNRGGGRGALAGVLQYIRQDEKTLWEGHRLVSGWNCTAPTAWQEIQLTKERFVKTDGWQYYHFVQFFAATDGLTPQEAHAIGLELAQRKFPDFEVLVATHIDTDILYSHLIVNSVSFQNGRKLHQSAADLQAHRLANDEICAAHHLSILPPPQKQVQQKWYVIYGFSISAQKPSLSLISVHSERYFQTLSLHFLMKGSTPYFSICGLPSRPRTFSTSSSTGRPCVSQPALRNTFSPFIT